MAEWISHRRLNGPDGHTPVLAALLTSAVVEENHHESLRPQLCSLFAETPVSKLDGNPNWKNSNPDGIVSLANAKPTLCL
ncbi:hypothetical protein CGGC5_v014031 [Colletotrichum fructicola Nara gc5]|uniref:Uncharacterized protein n=1 Tax=Colletotrichum fructicola (strain Nara gc5) TaxID=1213859 RepID=A0A7J6IRB4_COLFN|nr:hypothetical protein CGGC5_v014031 [Colletotrichum fructicola Nara gc5]